MGRGASERGQVPGSGFRVPKVLEDSGGFRGSRGFECAILDDVEVWRCGKLGRFGRYWRCISGWFGGEGFRGLRGIGKSTVWTIRGVLEVKTCEDSRFIGRFGGFRRSGRYIRRFCEELQVFFLAPRQQYLKGYF